MRGSATSLLGAPGVGKTLLGLTFLDAGAAAGEPGLYFGFFEARERIVGKAQNLGLRLASWCEQGLLHVAWQAPLEIFLDEVAERIVDLVTRHGARRVFIDGLEGFVQAAMHPERLPSFLSALTVLLRARGVTTFLSEELPIFTQTIEGTVISVSALVENVILMRYFEYAGEVRRLISIVKLRESDFDAAIREFRITQQGIVVGDKFSSVSQLLLGQPQPVEPRGIAPQSASKSD
ncbi:MAG: ATPase domain-containing protein [Thermodesulfobacteriota bacterium]